MYIDYFYFDNSNIIFNFSKLIKLVLHIGKIINHTCYELYTMY